jgi:nucleoside-diphosphate-sugar epimerase
MQSIGTVLVTGATGFIGRVLCAKLGSRGAEVRGLARGAAEGPWAQMIAADIGAGPLPGAAMQGVDTVFHLAGKVHALAQPGADESGYVRANVDGTRNVLEAAARAKVARFVFASSVKAGGEGCDVCLDEAMDDNPETPYGRTKLEAERLVFKFARQHEMHAVVLRLPLVYGPGSKGNLARMLEAVAARRFPPLPEFGNHRSLVHVEDVAEAAIRAAETPQANAQTYIVTDGRPYSTRDLYALMRAALGRKRPRLSIPMKALRAAARFGDMAGRVRGRQFFFDSDTLEKLASSAWYSSRKIETELGFKPAYDLEKALPEMVEAAGLGSKKGRKS